MKKKPIVLTMGEPSGIATEIAIKSWLKRKKLAANRSKGQLPSAFVKKKIGSSSQKSSFNFCGVIPCSKSNKCDFIKNSSPKGLFE